MARACAPEKSGSARLAGIELGGTKAIAVLSDGKSILAHHQIATRGPERTLDELNAILRGWDEAAGLTAMGIATFGPVQLNPSRPAYGHMLDTPKTGWSGADIAGELIRGLACPWRLDTDVNAAALAEWRSGAAQGCNSVAYITVGTGVGGGLVINGQPVHGAMHPEVGHLRLRRVTGDAFPGACRFHGDCIEGLVSGPALARRFGMEAPDVADDHSGWVNVAADLGELAAAILLTTSAERIVMGGSVALGRSFLFAHIRQGALGALNGYLPHVDELTIADVVVPAALGASAGPLGAIELAGIAAGAI